MIKVVENGKYIAIGFVLALLYAGIPCSAFSIPDSASIVTGLPPRSLELDDVRFSGNTFFSDEVLSSIITSRPSQVSLTRRVVRWYAQQIHRNTAAPNTLVSALDKIQKQAGDELQYYIPSSAASDSLAIVLFYREHGYHRVNVKYYFYYDPESKKNVLEFAINENPRATIDTIVYTGLQDLPGDIAAKIAALQGNVQGKDFSQSAVASESDKILRLLRNNGFFYSRFAPPIVSYNPANDRDSVTVHFFVGKRQRISDISFIRDTTASTRSFIIEDMQRLQMDFKVGDWYNEEAVYSSINNLYALGTFALVLIDTTSRYTKQTDSTLSFRVLTKMRDIDDYNADIVSNRTPFDNAWNAGIELSYINRNLGGIGQNLNIFASALLRDLNRTLEQGIGDAQVEYQFGLRFGQPFLFHLLDQRVGLNAQALFSRQSIALSSPLIIQTINATSTFPMKLYEHTMFNNIVFDWSIEQQKPIGLAGAFNDARTEAITRGGGDPSQPSDTWPDEAKKNVAFAEAQFLPYIILNNITENKPYSLTSSRLGLSFIGAHRNHPFNPTAGYDINFGIEVAGILPFFLQGESKYVRLQSLLTYFYPFSPSSVWAFKFRVGHIFQTGNAGEDYVPFDRLFFAGGSNSVRAWQARRLRYLSYTQDNLDEIGQYELNSYADVLGAASIIEGSLEWRLSLFEKTRSPSMLRGQLERTGLAFFVDYGNTFNSSIDEQAYKFTLVEMLSNIAIGAGIGFRYDTPVGPVRIDFATRVFDPDESEERKWLFMGNRAPAFIWQIGIGHAF